MRANIIAEDEDAADSVIASFLRLGLAFQDFVFTKRDSSVKYKNNKTNIIYLQ